MEDDDSDGDGGKSGGDLNGKSGGEDRRRRRRYGWNDAIGIVIFHLIEHDFQMKVDLKVLSFYVSWFFVCCHDVSTTVVVTPEGGKALVVNEDNIVHLVNDCDVGNVVGLTDGGVGSPMTLLNVVGE
ncbi:hypothetical protein KFK09_009756 [Dendrobium nobile]|uniref:Uncharacterized protein n=1 Tax=Dendrobium nobile TaxID=94219 RepID=A0A8T3BNJ5_DENNO|nr:hypothetical protein KFK09_009756 [Dendrobium nobile]